MKRPEDQHMPARHGDMTTRERFHAVMHFHAFDRLPIVEWAPWWSETLARWREEGLPADLNDYRINEYFGLDIYLLEWPRPMAATCPKPAAHGAGICWNAEDYDRIRKHLYPRPAVDRPLWERMAERQARGDAVVWLALDGFFWFPRVLLGIENHLYAFYDQPKLIHRINADLAEWLLGVIDEVGAICRPDLVSFEEDMSYNHGPMLSRELFDEFLKPCYRRIVPRLKSLGSVVVVDSDGDVTAPAEWFEDAGLEGIFPLERQSGVDVAHIRARHPRLRFMGGFDKMTMNRGEDAMRAEFERLMPVAAQGGFIVGCDHQTPPGVSYRDYQTYLRLFREYAAEAGALSRSFVGAEGTEKKACCHLDAGQR